MEYVELTENGCETLRRERLLALEIDHYRLELLIREAGPDTASFITQQADIGRRISLYADYNIDSEGVNDDRSRGLSVDT